MAELSPRSGEGAAAGHGDDIAGLTVAASADGIVAVDDQGIIRLCNRAAANLLGRPVTELTGTPFGFPVLAGRVADVELLLPQGAKRVAEMRVTSTTLEGEPLHVVSLRDVTRRREAETELESALERQNVMVAVAAHELHTPLTAISALAHVLQNQQAGMRPTERAQVIDRIVHRVVRLQMLVHRLLTAARIEASGVPTAPARVPVAEVIIEQLADLGARPGEVTVSCQPSLETTADRAGLSMMLGNYLDNALTYGRPPIGIRVSQQNGWTEIRVSDEGPGVHPGFVPHLFERYTRGPGAEQRAGGTGLGLWIVRTFARANGGDAWYEPRTPAGSCFCLRLPAAPAGDHPRQ